MISAAAGGFFPLAATQTTELERLKRRHLQPSQWEGKELGTDQESPGAGLSWLVDLR